MLSFKIKVVGGGPTCQFCVCIFLVVRIYSEV